MIQFANGRELKIRKQYKSLKFDLDKIRADTKHSGDKSRSENEVLNEIIEMEKKYSFLKLPSDK